jgi:hypothetical protein
MLGSGTHQNPTDTRRGAVARERESRLIRRVEQSELQFKLSIAVWSTVHDSDYHLNYVEAFDDVAHTLTREEMSLTPEEEDMASFLLEWSAAHLLAVQMDTALDQISPNHFRIPRADFEAAKIIVRLVRNAFAHNPIEPVWNMRPQYRDRIFQVPNVILLDTHGLQGAGVRERHFGGFSSLLRLAQHLRTSHDNGA